MGIHALEAKLQGRELQELSGMEFIPAGLSLSFFLIHCLLCPLICFPLHLSLLFFPNLFLYLTVLHMPTLAHNPHSLASTATLLCFNTSSYIPTNP